MYFTLLFVNITLQALSSNLRELSPILTKITSNHQGTPCITEFIIRALWRPQCTANIIVDGDPQHILMYPKLFQALYQHSELVETIPPTKNTTERIFKSMRTHKCTVDAIVFAAEYEDITSSMKQITRYESKHHPSNILIILNEFSILTRNYNRLRKMLPNIHANLYIFAPKTSNNSTSIYSNLENCFFRTKATSIKVFGQCGSGKPLSAEIRKKIAFVVGGCELRVGARINEPFVYRRQLSRSGIEFELISMALQRLKVKFKVIYFENARKETLYGYLLNG